MNIYKTNNQSDFDAIVASQDKSQFNQSWNWGEFQVTNGSVVERVVMEEEGGIVAVASLISKPLMMGRQYFYCPRGPICADDLSNNKKQEIQNFFLTEMRKIAKQQKKVFLRFEPREIFPSDKFTVKQTIDIQPKKTILLDLVKSEDELLADMHQKTRYNIRLAEKKGVKVVEYGVDKFSAFWELMSQTTERDGFRAHGAGYYEKMLDVLRGEIKDKQTLVFKMFVAEHDGQPLAGLLAAFYGDTVTYVHGASSNTNRQLMAPFVLQWEVIKMAKQNGYKYYDFYGIDENKWPGVTRFKRGFGGEEDNWPGTFDMVFSSIWYNVYNGLRLIRRKIKFI